MDKHTIAWKEFVGVHEHIIQVLNSESEKGMACAEYGQQQNRKLELDAKLKEWRKSREAEHLDEIESKKSHKSSKSGSSCGSSASTKLSRQSKRKEKMALAQLKLQELKVLQEYEREEQELKRKRDLYVAEMEVKQATVSYQIVMEQDSNSCDLNVPMGVSVTKQQLNKGLASSMRVPDPLVDDKLENLCVAFDENVPVEQSPTLKLTVLKSPEQRIEASYGEGIAKVLQQVVNAPKIEHIKFNGDPLRYVTFIHNFESCLERDNHDEDRKLQLLTL